METGIFQELKDLIIQADRDQALNKVASAVEAGVDPTLLVTEGLGAAMTELGRLWDEGATFLPEVLASAELFKECMAVIEPYQLARGTKTEPLGRVVMGTVHGDLHDLGKNIVTIMLRTAGFEVIDLGKNVPIETFVRQVEELKPDIVGLSALLTTTLIKQKETIQALREAGVRQRVMVMIGGAPATEAWAGEIGADAYAANAPDAVERAKRLVSTLKGGQ